REDATCAGDGCGAREGARGARQRARRATALGRPRRADLVRPRRTGRGASGSARRRARPRGEARVRRLLPAGDAERPRGRRGLAGGGGGRAHEARPRRAAARLGRRGDGRSARSFPGGTGRRSRGDHDVRRPRPRVGRPRPPGDELPRARRAPRQPRGPAPAAAPDGDPAGPGRAPLDRPARGAFRAPPERRARVGRRPPRSAARTRRARRDARRAGTTFARNEPRRPAPARPLPRPLLRAGGRARAGAPVPAAGRRARALARRREPARDLDRRRRAGQLERHEHAPARPRQPEARGRRRPRRRRARRSALGRRGGDPDVILAATEPWWIGIIKAAIIINVLLISMAFTTLLERKLLGRMQLRYGPNRAGPYGLLQPFADLIKMVRKEAFAPVAAIDLLYIAAPAFSAFTALTAFSVIPFGEGWKIWHYHVDGEVANVPISLILIFALGSLGIYGFIIGGWA